jgi:hypothetical protein
MRDAFTSASFRRRVMPNFFKLMLLSLMLGTTRTTTQSNTPDDSRNTANSNQGFFNAGLAQDSTTSCLADEVPLATIPSILDKQYLLEEMITSSTLIDPDVSDAKTANEFAAKVVKIIMQACNESQEVGRYIKQVMRSPNFSIRITDINLYPSSENELDPIAVLGSFEFLSNKLCLDTKLNAAPEAQISTLIKHEFWHAAQYERNRILTKETQITPAPFIDQSTYILLQEIFQITRNRCLELMQINSQINLFGTGTPVTDILIKKYQYILEVIKQHPMSAETQYILSNLEELKKYNINPIYKDGKETYLGAVIVYRDDGTAQKIFKIEEIPAGGHKIFVEANSALDALAIIITRIFALLKYEYYKSKIPLLYTELDCYLHTSLPEEVRKAVMPELENYHVQREQKYLALIAKNSAEENDNPTSYRTR